MERCRLLQCVADILALYPLVARRPVGSSKTSNLSEAADVRVACDDHEAGRCPLGGALRLFVLVEIEKRDPYSSSANISRARATLSLSLFL